MPFTIFAIALATAGQAPAAPVEKPKLICREGEAVTGTRRRVGRRCRTAEQWQQEDAKLDRIPPTLRVTRGQEDGRPVQNPQ